MELNLISECPVTIPQQNRESITRNIGGDEIGEGVMIKVFGGNSSGILADLVAGEIIERIRWVIRLALGTGPQAVTEEKRQP
jgi:hypothetical protein